MSLPGVDEPRITTYFDEATRIMHVVYRQDLATEITLKFYHWREELLDQVDVKTIKGTIVDFRKVIQFPPLNLPTVYKESRDANRDVDMSHIPVAYIVATPQQERNVQLSMKVTPQASRRRIVKSDEEALAFIAEWHQSHSPLP
jgi:hypothetical protein